MIFVEQEPIELDEEVTFECCCFCRKPTRFWYTPNDVACCKKCAEVANPEDVPSKEIWIRRETIAESKNVKTNFRGK